MNYVFVGILQPNCCVLFPAYVTAITHLQIIPSLITKADITSLSTTEAASLTRTLFTLLAWTSFWQAPFNTLYCFLWNCCQELYLSRPCEESVKQKIPFISTSQDWFDSIQLLFTPFVVSDFLQPHELQRSRLHCPSLSPWVCSNSCPLSQRYHSAISSYVIPFSSSPQSYPASRSFPISWLLASDGWSTETSASAPAIPMNIQDWFPFGLIGLISLCARGSQESSPTPQFKSINSSALSLLYGPNLTSVHDY